MIMTLLKVIYFMLCCMWLQAAADTLATISWVSRFSTATKSGAGGVLVSFSWEVAADPEAYG
jgi:hypothetical protein